MAKLFCPKCGSETDIFYDKVCKECFSFDKKLVDAPIVAYSKICTVCNSVYKKGKWLSKIDEVEGMLDSVKDSININKEAQEIEIVFSEKKLDYSRYSVTLNIKASIKGIPFEESHKIEVRINRETCDACSRISGGYFEGIVQIRAENRLPTKYELEKCVEIADEVSNRCEKKGDRLSFISKTEKLDEGIDLYIGQIKLGRQICKAIIDVFGGKYAEYPKLVGQKNGVDLYRITFAMRLSEFVRGDIISVDGKIIEVQSIGKHISGYDLETGKRFIENINSLLDVKKLCNRNDGVLAVLIADEGQTIQILHPDTYESVTIKKPDFLDVKPGNEINIVKTEKGIFVLP